MAKPPPITEEQVPHLMEMWTLGPWHFTEWRDFDGNEPTTWYRFGPRDHRPTGHDDRYKSIGEAMLVAAASQYEVEQTEAQWTAFMCARLIGMHQYDGNEWVHQPPLVSVYDA